MIRQRGWDPEGAAARRADEIAHVPRHVNYVSFDERQQRNWWRLVASNREPQGRGTQRQGYLAPGTNVPGATPSDIVKGNKGKGGKDFGNKGLAPSLRAAPCPTHPPQVPLPCGVPNTPGIGVKARAAPGPP